MKAGILDDENKEKVGDNLIFNLVVIILCIPIVFTVLCFNNKKAYRKMFVLAIYLLTITKLLHILLIT